MRLITKEGIKAATTDILLHHVDSAFMVTISAICLQRYFTTHNPGYLLIPIPFRFLRMNLKRALKTSRKSEGLDTDHFAFLSGILLTAAAKNLFIHLAVLGYPFDIYFEARRIKIKNSKKKQPILL